MHTPAVHHNYVLFNFISSHILYFQTEVEDMVKRYQQMEGVEGLIIYNCEGK